MKNKFDKINVLLIEDNPTQIGGFEGSKFKDENGNKLFAESLDSVIIPSVNLRNFHTDLSHHFHLKVLQHPIEVKEFIQLARDAEQEIGFSGIGNISGILPNIIVFDYLLWQNVETNKIKDKKDSKTFNILYNDNSAPIRRFLNPNFELLSNLKHSRIKQLQLEENGEYSEEEFLLSLNKEKDIANVNAETLANDRRELHSDDMGLFCGISIWQLFRSHISVPIPATHNKDQIEKLKAHSKFYEWLYEHELGHVTQEKYRGQKTWADIIPKSVERLRERVFSMASQFRVAFDLENILQLVSGAHIDELKKTDSDQDPLKAGFTFTTPYGKQCFHLAALFLDIQDENERNIEIKDFATKIFQLYGVDLESYKRIEASYKKIWKTFCKSYERVFEFSNLQLQNYYIEILENETATEKDNRKKIQDANELRISQLKTELGVIGTGLDVDFNPEVSVFKEKLSNTEKTKVLLLLITRLYWNYLEAIKKGNTYLGEITNEEIAILLSPLRSEYSDAPCILPLHRAKIPASIRNGKNLKNQFANTPNNIGSLFGKGQNQTPAVFNLNWISPQDKKFVCSFFNREINELLYGNPGIRLYMDERLKNIVL